MLKITPITFPTPEVHAKAWGQENWIWNDQYCLKLLQFKAGHMFSDHFHFVKDELWLVSSGQLILSWYDLSTASRQHTVLNPGQVVHVPPGNPHQLSAVVDSIVIEVSTKHEDHDSYRIGKGSSQMPPSADPAKS